MKLLRPSAILSPPVRRQQRQRPMWPLRRFGKAENSDPPYTEPRAAKWRAFRTHLPTPSLTRVSKRQRHSKSNEQMAQLRRTLFNGLPTASNVPHGQPRFRRPMHTADRGFAAMAVAGEDCGSGGSFHPVWLLLFLFLLAKMVIVSQPLHCQAQPGPGPPFAILCVLCEPYLTEYLGLAKRSVVVLFTTAQSRRVPLQGNERKGKRTPHVAAARTVIRIPWDCACPCTAKCVSSVCDSSCFLFIFLFPCSGRSTANKKASNRQHGISSGRVSNRKSCHLAPLANIWMGPDRSLLGPFLPFGLFGNISLGPGPL